MSRNKARVLPTVAVAAALGVLGLTAGCSTSLSDSVVGAEQRPMSSRADGPVKVAEAASDPTVCTTGYNSGEVSIDVSMYNGTDQPLTLNAALSGHNGENEHWATQPPATLAPGQCAHMTAYSDITGEPVGAHAVYELPNGDFVPFSADSHNSSENSTVFTAEPTYSWGSTSWSGPQDPTYNIQSPASSGNFHVHVVLKLEGGATDSYQDTSSSFTIAANKTTPTWSAACGLGHHVRIDPSTDKPMVTIASTSGDASALTFQTLKPTSADGTVDGTTQYQGLDYALNNSSPTEASATITWTCDPSVWGTNGTAPTWLQNSPAAELPAQTPTTYRFSTLAFPAATYGVPSGQLPNGLTLNPSGDLTGTPTTPGTYDFTVKASNDVGSVTTNQLSITVQ